MSGLCNKKKYRCPDCPNRALTPLSAPAVKAHPIGHDPLCRDVVGIYPMLEDNTTWLLAADFDEQHWQLDVSAFAQSSRELGLSPAVERSRSGNGAHVWFFFFVPVSAREARQLGTGLLTRTMSQRHELSFSSYDRLFSSQDMIPKGGFGNLIALPFQGQAQKAGNTLFVDEHFSPYPNQWAFLSSLPRISPTQLSDCLQQLQIDDGRLDETDGPTEKLLPWQHRRTVSPLTQEDFPPQVSLTLSTLIYIRKEGFSKTALYHLKRMSAFRNPEFFSRQAMRLSVYGLPRFLDCGYVANDYIGLPRGCMDGLMNLFGQYEIFPVLEDHRCSGRPIDVSFRGTLRAEQEPAAQALLAADTGVLSATTAFGKRW